MMDKVSVGCIVYLIVVFERLQNHLKIYVNKIENITYVSLYIINIIRKNVKMLRNVILRKSQLFNYVYMTFILSAI